jgi:hypothetical protein
MDSVTLESLLSAASQFAPLVERYLLPALQPILTSAPFLGWYALVVMTWVFYLAAMNLMPHLKTMHPIARAHAYAVVVIALALDVVINVIVGTVLFLDPPRELLLTNRLKRYQLDARWGGTWRASLAFWLCTHLLDQFDPNGDHC